ncbi:Protein CSF1 [Cyphellophora attinorum]|uniref:Protein CSF1 n=1 Tax=Cyphellophora attinorum TaxID=1664694 RepID=A0A0N0NQM4_9EURO|nr:Protein CSF1 [Phialophora attinorum]KPI44078.1 Protein CSF1 [Phialophora attinorum]
MVWNLFPRFGGGTFNWTWTIELVVCITLTIWFLFYFNRVFATLVSYGARAYAWKKLKVWVDIQAIQISLLGGRIFFKGIRYHGENETIYIQQGYITWRYYSFNARQVNLIKPKKTTTKGSEDGGSSPDDSTEEGDVQSQKTAGPPGADSVARVLINVTGLEWFVYNRTPAYDAILAAADRPSRSAQGDPTWTIKPGSTDSSSNEKKASGVEERERGSSSAESKPEVEVRRKSSDVKTEEEDESFDRDQRSTHSGLAPADEAPVSAFYSLMLALLPIGVECNRGAISLGNESTRAIVVTTFAKAKGHIDAAAAEDKDIFRQIFDFEIENPMVQMKPNPDFRHSQMAAAERIIQGIDTPVLQRRWWQINLDFRRRRHDAAHKLKNLTPGFTGSVESFRPHSHGEKSNNRYTAFGYEGDEAAAWYGLDRYLDENDRDDHEAWSHVDYARFSTILDCPAVHFNFYWDIQGPVPSSDAVTAGEGNGYLLNGDVPPAYGMNLVVKGGDVNYGPWADRLRLEIQSAFFPNAYRSATPTEPPEAGDLRIYTIMNIRVDIEKDVTLRVPTRELSKDWQWRGRAHAAREAAMVRRQRERRPHFSFRKNHKQAAGPEVRPFGWFSFTVGPDTIVKYDMAMIPDADGYQNSLDLDLVNTRATSSVNHAVLWRCPSHKINAKLPYPLGWNHTHDWVFNVESDSLEMFILRDHMFLLIDLISDFTAGQKADFMTFVPYIYNMGLVFHDLKLYLNANDFNIIDTPTNLDENAYLILGFELLDGSVGIPQRYFAPRQSEVLFKAKGKHAYMDISSPQWNTMRTFLQDEDYIPDLKTMATLKGLEMEGSYNYYTAQAPHLSDSLFMTIIGISPRFHLHGFLIRYFMNVKENYFGEHLHFRTLEEYQALIDPDRPATANPRPTSKENDLDVILAVRADESSILIPSNIYTRRKGVRADILMVEADMRFTNYYMDLQVNSSPIEVSLETIKRPGQKPDVSSTQIFIQEAVVFGHRLFGAPPSEPTYSCHWDIDVGIITGQCSSEFLATLIQGVGALIYTMDDFENSLPDVLSVSIYDVNFVRARAAGIKLWLVAESTALLVDISPLTVDFDDWAGEHFAKHINVDVPGITVAAVDAKSALRHAGSGTHNIETLALFKTSLRLATLDKTSNLARTRAMQQAHIRFSDQRTHRTEWLLHKRPTEAAHRNDRKSEWSKHPPGMPVPVVPNPLHSIDEALDERLHDLGLRRQPSSISSRSRRQEKSSTFLDKSILRTSSQLSVSKEPLNVERSIGAVSLATSSSWAPPHFPLANASPSCADMPESFQAPPSVVRRVPKSFPATDEDWAEDGKHSHMGLIVSLEQGLVGFCKPGLLMGIASLISALQPKAALDRFDAVQQEVITLVMQKLRPMVGEKTLDLDIRLPYAHLRFIHDGHDLESPSAAYKDQFDIQLLRGRADVRFISRQVMNDPDHPMTHGLLIHTSVDSLSIAGSDTNVAHNDRPARSALSISKLGVWFSSKERLRGMVQVADIETEVEASMLDQLAQMIARTSTMVDSLVDRFSNIDDSLKTRHLVYHLTQAATGAASDPGFLTRPSYVLRSTENHIRSSESWKILSRLRYVFAVADRETAHGVYEDCPCSGLELQDSARSQMVQAFDEWGTWDSIPDNRMPVVTALFGQDAKVDGSMSVPRFITLELTLGNFEVVLDPGPAQSNVSLGGLEVAATFDPGFRGLNSSGDSRVVVQIYSAQFVVNLKWELVELASELVRLLQAQPNTSSTTVADHQASTSALDRFVVEAVVCADLTSINVQSKNLTLKLGAENLSTSSILAVPANSEMSFFITVTSRVAIARLIGLDKGLLVWRLIESKISSSFVPTYSADEADALPIRRLRVAAACTRLRFKLKEDIPFVMKVVRAVVDNEVAEVLKLFFTGPVKLKRPKLERTEPKRDPKVEFHIALFLEDYKLDFVLLPSLRYSIDGQVARTSVIPRGQGKMMVNFDLKEHQHAFRGTWSSTYERPSSLQMPPINGQISIESVEEILTLGVHSTIEQVEFELSAVRACFDVVNQPGFINTIKSTQNDIKATTERINELFTPAAAVTVQTNVPKPPLTVRFSADGTLMGLRINCHAPSLRDSEARTDLNFVIGRTAVRVHNMISNSTKIWEKPQFSAGVQEVSIGLVRRERYSGSNCGRLSTGIHISGVTEVDEKNNHLQVFRVSSKGINVDMYEETASLLIDVASFLQERIKSITISDEAKNLKPIRRLTMATLGERPVLPEPKPEDVIEDDDASTHLFDSVVSVDIDRIQLVPHSHDPLQRSANSALLPEVIFSVAYLSTKKERRIAFQAKGKALDLRLRADFVIPAAMIQKSLSAASTEIRNSNVTFSSNNAGPPETRRKTVLSRKRFAWLAVDADFAGAFVHISPRPDDQPRSRFHMLKGPSRSRAGRYLQAVHGEHATQAALQAPGIAIKVQYRDNGADDPVLSTEVKVAASSNILYPSVVPLIMEISSSVKELMGDETASARPQTTPQPTAQQATAKYLTEGSLEPHAVLGRTRLNAGLWIQRQEFSLSCQPIARVSATAKFEEIFLSVTTVQGPDHRFFSVLMTFNKLQSSVQHVYSRESTASFELDSIVLSLMNSKHVSGTTGISAIVNLSPMSMDINAKQLQDFLLFREIWYPAELRGSKQPAAAPVSATTDTQAFAIQRYQQIAASGTLPWSAIVSVQEIKMQIDAGPMLGKSVLTVSKLWASSKKNSDAEQNLCVGFDRIGIDSTGRMSGFVELDTFRVRTSIRWPEDVKTSMRAPLVQASVGFDHLRTKMVFDYQPFGVADVSNFEAMMYNVRQDQGQNDRLVAMVNSGKVQAFITTMAGAQGLALVQTCERLMEDKKEAFHSSLMELDKQLRRKSVFPTATWVAPVQGANKIDKSPAHTGLSLHTDVVVALGEIDVGIFPNTFFDAQILKLEATDAQARFAVAANSGQVESELSMRLGQVRVALSNVSKHNTKALGEVSVPDVIDRATTSRGGTILKVPALHSSMRTWQKANDNTVEYIFRSTFEGKVDVGWNYSRISFIRDMWQTHSRAFAARAGKPLPEPAVKITAQQGSGGKAGEGEKITAVVNMPVASNKYRYVALQPPVIDTPQLRDLGEATPSLEWIGLHRDRLPEATHSVAIVTLLEVCKEVEDAYVRILGST